MLASKGNGTTDGLQPTNQAIVQELGFLERLRVSIERGRSSCLSREVVSGPVTLQLLQLLQELSEVFDPEGSAAAVDACEQLQPELTRRLVPVFEEVAGAGHVMGKQDARASIRRRGPSTDQH
jgi:hypothetical protein